jgi:hypothetical protein
MVNELGSAAYTEQNASTMANMEKVWMDGRWVILVSAAAAEMVRQEASIQGEQL